MQIFEIIMLICFGMSWPISVYKSIRSKSTKGKSVVFIIAIIIGYISGIIGKIVSIKEETCVIETTHERTKIRILKTAVSRVDVKAEDSES